MESVPQISVILCVYNGEASLAEAIRSILAQTFRDFELIVIDDGSSDRSHSIASAFAKEDARVRVFHQTNQGLTKSLNLGLKMARGKYIARQDADDFSLPQRLQDSHRQIGQDGLLLSAWINRQGERKKVPFFSRLILMKLFWILRLLHLFFNPYVHGTYFFRRDLALAIGGYREKFRFAQDYDFLLRMSHVAKIGYLNKVTYELSLHAKSISQSNRILQLACSCLAAIENMTAKNSNGSIEQSLKSLIHAYPLRSLLVTFFQLVRYRDKDSFQFVLHLWREKT